MVILHETRKTFLKSECLNDSFDQAKCLFGTIRSRSVHQFRDF